MALIDVISEEQVIVGVDVSRFSWGFPDVKEAHEVDVLPMDVADDLHWWSNLLYNYWLSSQNLAHFIGKLDDVLALARELSTRFDLLAFFWLE